MIDIVDEVNAIHRETSEAKTPVGAGRTVVLRREYRATVEDVWEAITDPERIRRWFLPVIGRPAGRRALPGRGQRRRGDPGL